MNIMSRTIAVLLFVIIVVISSCDSQKVPVEYYNDGQLKMVGDSTLEKQMFWKKDGDLDKEQYYEDGERTMTTYYLEREIVRRSHYGYGEHLYDDNYSIGWELASEEEKHFDASIMDNLVNKLPDLAAGKIYSLLIVTGGKITYEKYFHRHQKNRASLTYTITQMVQALLLGIALDQGVIKSVDDKFINYFEGHYGDIKNLDSLKKTITIRQLLTMTPGFTWHEWAGKLPEMLKSRDWVRNVLEQPMLDVPGEKYMYNGGCSQIMAGIIQVATGLNSEAYAKKYLFDPLGIGNYRWSSDIATNMSDAVTGLSLTPRALAKIGSVYLNEGKWKGNQIVSNAWVEESLKPHVLKKFANPPLYFGYMWNQVELLITIDAEEGSTMAVVVNYAEGYGGQFIFLIPEMDMVVVTTGRNDLFRDLRKSYWLISEVLTAHYVI